MNQIQSRLGPILALIISLITVAAEWQNNNGIDPKLWVRLTYGVVPPITNMFIMYLAIRQYRLYNNKLLFYIAWIFGFRLLQDLWVSVSRLLMEMIKGQASIEFASQSSMIFNYIGFLLIPGVWIYALWTYREKN